jgi:hypothetical protein
MKNDNEKTSEKANDKTGILAEIAHLEAFRENVADGTEWARYIDDRLRWLRRKLEPSGGGTDR